MTNRIGTLVAAGALVLAMTTPARTEERRGWVYGGGVTGGRLSFANAEGRGVALGPVDGFTVVYGTLLEHRDLKVFDASGKAPAAEAR